MTSNYLPKNAAEFPKTSAARTFMVETANKFADEYAEELCKLGKEDKLQKKLLNIQKSMAELCATFAALGFNQPTWEKQIENRTRILTRHTDIMAEYGEALADLPTDDERYTFILFAHTNWFLHNAFIDKHLASLNAAVADGHPEQAFEDKLILGTLYTVCREWRAWWKANGPLPFDRWTYEDSPWEVE